MDPLEATFGQTDADLVADAEQKYSIGDKVEVHTGLIEDGEECIFYGTIAELRGRAGIGGGLMNIFRPSDHPDVLRNRSIGEYGYTVDDGNCLLYYPQSKIFPDSRKKATSDS